MKRVFKLITVAAVVSTFLSVTVFAKSHRDDPIDMATVKQMPNTNVLTLIGSLVTSEQISKASSSKFKSTTYHPTSSSDEGEEDDDNVYYFERETRESWHEDDAGDKWYSWEIYERESEDENWEKVGEGQSKEGSPGYKEKP